jgi:protease-4
VVALLLRVNSPGGTVSASETLYHELERWKERSGKPVVAYLQGLATSGGYYVAMSADEVVAHPTAITGSIGVVMLGINVSGLMERFGVEDQTFTSGDFKDAGSALRPMRPEERAYFDEVIGDLHVPDFLPRRSNRSRTAASSRPARRSTWGWWIASATSTTP